MAAVVMDPSTNATEQGDVLLKPSASGPAANVWPPSSFPDRGAKAWLNVAGCTACRLCSFGWVNSLGIWQDYYVQDQLKQYSESEVSWVSAFQRTLCIRARPSYLMIWWTMRVDSVLHARHWSGRWLNCWHCVQGGLMPRRLNEAGWIHI